MDFIDDDSRPRFLLNSRPPPPPSSQPQNPSSKPHGNLLMFIITTPISLLLLAISLLQVQSQFLQSLLLWVSFSLLIGPFAPLSLTAGHITVGRGPLLDFPPQQNNPPEELNPKTLTKRPQKGKRGPDSSITYSDPGREKIGDLGFESRDETGGEMGFDLGGSEDGGLVEEEEEEEREWSEEDLELLRKQLLKHPVGKVRRWEVISEAFKGRHGVSSVIKAAKSLGEAKPVDKDSYSKFLRNRKPVDKRVVEEGIGGGDDDDGGGFGVEGVGSGSWSSGEDIALLNALKVFPKEVSMRWEKIAAAVPGKSKAACMKRVSELKKVFRSSKAAAVSES